MKGHYLAALCLHITLLTSAPRIVLGGGLCNRDALLAKVRAHYAQLRGSYLSPNERLDGAALENYLSRSALFPAENIGLLGVAAAAALRD